MLMFHIVGTDEIDLTFGNCKVEVFIYLNLLPIDFSASNNTTRMDIWRMSKRAFTKRW